MRIALAGLAALAVAMGIGRFAFTPILPMMLQDTGLSVAGGGWLASVNYLGYFLGALWAGAMRVRPALAIRAGLAAIALATLAMSLDAGFGGWAVLRFLAGVASAWVLIHTSSWVLERVVPLGRPILAGVLYAGVGTGIAVAGVLCVALMTAHAGSSAAWLLLGIASLAVTCLVWPVFSFSNEAETRTVRDSFWTWEQARLVAAYGTHGFGYIIPATFLPVMAKEVVDNPAVFGWAWPVYGAAAALSTLGVALLSGWHAKPGGNRVAWIASQLVMALGVAAPVVSPSVGGIALAALCVGGTFVVITMAGLQVARTVAGAQAPRLMAAMTAAFAAGQVAGPLAVSLLVGAGGFSAALLIACAVLVAGAVLLMWGTTS
jgi:MFS family permease